MAKNVWFLSRTINRYLGNDLFLIRAKKQRRQQRMKGSFYHDKIEGPQKVKAYFIAAEKDNISTTTVYDEIGQMVLYNDELYIYTKDLEYKKISVAS